MKVSFSSKMGIHVLTLLVPNQKLHSALSANIYKIVTAQKRLKLLLT